MERIARIQREIETLSIERVELWRTLSAGRDQDVVARLRTVNARLALLWDEQRAERARLRFGDPDEIVNRARREDRLDRAA